VAGSVAESTAAAPAWWFALGMIALAADSILKREWLSLISLEKIGLLAGMGADSEGFLVAIWLGFAVTIREAMPGDSFVVASVLIATHAFPVAALLGFRG